MMQSRPAAKFWPDFCLHTRGIRTDFCFAMRACSTPLPVGCTPLFPVDYTPSSFSPGVTAAGVSDAPAEAEEERPTGTREEVRPSRERSPTGTGEQRARARAGAVSTRCQDDVLVLHPADRRDADKGDAGAGGRRRGVAGRPRGEVKRRMSGAVVTDGCWPIQEVDEWIWTLLRCHVGGYSRMWPAVRAVGPKNPLFVATSPRNKTHTYV